MSEIRSKAAPKPDLEQKIEKVVEVTQPMISLTSADFHNIISSAVSAALQAANSQQKTIQETPRSEAVANSVAFQQRLAKEQASFSQFHADIAADTKNFINVEIPLIYAKYIGKFQTITWNGSIVKIPVDGNRYTIHKGFLPILMEKLRYVSEKVSREQHQDQLTGLQGDIRAVSPR